MQITKKNKYHINWVISRKYEKFIPRGKQILMLFDIYSCIVILLWFQNAFNAFERIFQLLLKFSEVWKLRKSQEGKLNISWNMRTMKETYSLKFLDINGFRKYICASSSSVFFLLIRMVVKSF